MIDFAQVYLAPAAVIAVLFTDSSGVADNKQSDTIDSPPTSKHNG
jgi:hypothetical protein